jgi:hypothetical protein
MAFGGGPVAAGVLLILARCWVDLYKSIANRLFISGDAIFLDFSLPMTEAPASPPPTPTELTAVAEGFWQSVRSEQEALRARPLVELVDRLNDLLEAAVPGVAVEAEGAGPDLDSGAGRLVFTSHGSTDHFAAVQAVVAQAPKGLPWPVTAFRQRTGAGFGMRMDRFELATQDLRVRVGQCAGRWRWPCPLPTLFGRLREHYARWPSSC